MKNLIFTIIIFFSFLIVQNLNAQSKAMSLQKNQIKNIEGLKGEEYFPISEKQYNSLMNVKDKKEISLDDGNIVYMITAQQLEVVGMFTKEQLDRLKQAVCSFPLEPGDLCEDNCRDCPEGYFCSPALRLGTKICLETERDEKQCEDIFLVQPGGKRCVPLPTR